MTCVIISGGDVQEKISIPEQALVICADCGYRHALQQNIRPDVLIGDFDSYTEPLPEQIRIVRYPAEKDISDTWAAMELGRTQGCNRFIIYGAFGGERADHSFANIQLLHAIAEQGMDGCLFYQKQMISVFIGGEGKKLVISGKSRQFSLFSLSECCTDVTIQGAKYPLAHHELKHTFPLGLSNEVADEQAEITVRSGTLLVFQDN